MTVLKLIVCAATTGSIRRLYSNSAVRTLELHGDNASSCVITSLNNVRTLENLCYNLLWLHASRTFRGLRIVQKFANSTSSIVFRHDEISLCDKLTIVIFETGSHFPKTKVITTLLRPLIERGYATGIMSVGRGSARVNYVCISVEQSDNSR